MRDNYIAAKDVCAFSAAVNLLRTFFLNRGFVEAHTQDRLSILAACEDPSTVATYTYQNTRWPLPQTGQMWLEYELLRAPELPGVFTVSTSYRQEQNPTPGRHELIFPMFEFEAHGTMNDLRELERELCEYLGLGNLHSFVHKNYDELARHYRTDDLTGEHEMRMGDDFGPVVFLEHFPLSTSPFWNMKKQGEHASKIDVILHGMETIGSAERSSDTDEMYEQFHTISNGEYATLLFEQFGKERVKEELESYLSFDFFPRYGGGIGMTRLMRALKLAGKIPQETDTLEPSAAAH